jgi:hypothetical protein
MNRLASSLVFGCSRLTGGATERDAIAMVKLCLDLGIRHFDTAPSYGMGTAEKVVGKALKHAPPDVKITLKVGSQPDPKGVLKSYLRMFKRAVTSSSPDPSAYTLPKPPRMTAAPERFRPSTMAASLERSLDLVGRAKADVLLMHEAFAADANPDATEFLDRMQGIGKAASVGYSNGSAFTPEVDAAFPRHWVAQTSVPPQLLLTGTGAFPTNRPVFLHSLVKVTLALKRQDVAFAQRLALAAAVVKSDAMDVTAAEVAASIAFVNHVVPHARLIYSSTNEGRLSGVLGALETIDLGRQADLVAVLKI